jgi:hypothetical protein
MPLVKRTVGREVTSGEIKVQSTGVFHVARSEMLPGDVEVQPESARQLRELQRLYPEEYGSAVFRSPGAAPAAAPSPEVEDLKALVRAQAEALEQQRKDIADLSAFVRGINIPVPTGPDGEPKAGPSKGTAIPADFPGRESLVSGKSPLATLEEVRAASDQDLLDRPEIGRATLQRIRAAQG